MLLDVLAPELDHRAAVHADHVVVVLALQGPLVAALAVGEVVALDDPGVLEEAEPAVDGRHGDGLALLDEALVELLGGEVALLVEGGSHHLAALARHLQPLGAQELLEGGERMLEVGCPPCGLQ